MTDIINNSRPKPGGMKEKKYRANRQRPEDNEGPVHNVEAEALMSEVGSGFFFVLVYARALGMG